MCLDNSYYIFSITLQQYIRMTEKLKGYDMNKQEETNEVWPIFCKNIQILTLNSMPRCCCIDFPRNFIKTMGYVFILLFVIWNTIFFLIVNSNLMTWNRVSATWYNLQLINNNNPHYSFVSKCYNILPWHFTLCHKISYTDTDIKLKN